MLNYTMIEDKKVWQYNYINKTLLIDIGKMAIFYKGQFEDTEWWDDYISLEKMKWSTLKISI